jgi:hypothetical protein
MKSNIFGRRITSLWRGEFRKLADRYGLTNARVLASALFADLKSILRSYDVHFFCLGCPIATLQAVRREPRPWIVLDSDPYVMVHEELIYRTVRMVRESIRPDTIAFIFDENAKVAAFNDISWAEFKRSVYPSSVAQCMTTLVPLDDKQFPALQAADLIAHTARRTFRQATGERFDQNVATFTTWRSGATSCRIWRSTMQNIYGSCQS